MNKTQIRNYLSGFIMLLLIAACTSPKTNTITQVSTIDALLAGVYDGSMSCKELLTHGNFGIGTFDRLTGEMIILDGTVYQIKADGKVYRPTPNTTTPFAAVCQFLPEKSFSLKGSMNYEAMQKAVNAEAANQNIFCALRVKGKFRSMKTRSVPAQNKPYPPLAEVAKTQPVFEMEEISGTLVGFRCPSYVKGVNVPGWHLHFLCDDHTRGGHVLDFEMIHGEAELDFCHSFFMILPEKSSEFADTDLSMDRSDELHRVEK